MFRIFFYFLNSVYLSHYSFINTGPFTRADSFKYLAITSGKTLSSHNSNFVKDLRRPSISIKVLRLFQIRQNTTSLLDYQYFSRSPLLFACNLWDLLKKNFRTIRCGLTIINGVPCIPLKELCTKLCIMHVSASENMYIIFFLTRRNSYTAITLNPVLTTRRVLIRTL